MTSKTVENRYKDGYIYFPNPVVGLQKRHNVKNGYIAITKPEHPFADNIGWVLEHHLVWEFFNQAILLPNAHVHHKNDNRKENMIENLEAMTIEHHNRIHKTNPDLENRHCAFCGSTKTYLRNRVSEGGKRIPRPQWSKNKNGDGWICGRCYLIQWRCIKSSFP